MLSEIQSICAVIYTPNAGEATTLRQGLIACGINNIHTAKGPDRFLAICASAQPDVAIISLSPELGAALSLIRDVRAGAQGANRYLPIIAAKHNPSSAAVHGAINSGTHEFLLLPASIKSLSTLIHRAVFISRPFISAPGYAGPCRRRRQNAIAQVERRLAPWPGYVHAAHKAQAADAAS